MAPPKSIWYHLGHAYERARLARSEAAGPPARRPGTRPRAGADGPSREVAWPTADELFSAAAWLVVDRVAGTRTGKRRPGIGGLLRAGAAGAAAALLVDLLRPLLLGDADVPLVDEGTFDRLIAGVGQGLVYGALVEPTVPGPALVKGALYGSVEYAMDPMGGLSALFGAHTPQGRIPVIGEMLEGMAPHDRAYFEHLVFGIALALLYESSPASNGTLVLDEDDEA